MSNHSACAEYIPYRLSQYQIETAYRMAVLSTIVYYPFHKKILFSKFRVQRVMETFWCPLWRLWKFLTRRRDAPQVLQFRFYNWFEPTFAGTRYHDTDLIVATHNKNELSIAFAGTESPSDHFTNIQTFEPANHSALLGMKSGSLHRGFLNAYSRVSQGSILRLCDKDCSPSLVGPLMTAYGHCTLSRNKTRFHPTKEIRQRKRGGCRVKKRKLRDILCDLVADALKRSKTVHITGHSLGGGLATLLFLDVLVNFDVPVKKLHLWTFGAPQVADDQLLNTIERLDRASIARFVTLSEASCRADMVSNVTSWLLPSHRKNLRGHAARRLGGVRGNVAHITRPYHLLCEDSHLHATASYVTSIAQKSTCELSTDLEQPELLSWIGSKQVRS